MKTAWALLALACALGCEPHTTADGDRLGEKALDARADHHWIYDGPLPRLDAWRLRFSLRGHTVRVTGLLPTGWRRPLPHYVRVRDTPDARREVTVVYPASTAAAESVNADPGRYLRLTTWAHTPSDIAGRGVPWGGFPYLEFDAARAIAFHGPITAQGEAWRLLRGPVSHGCARMQGEHIVELAHLVGLDVRSALDVAATFRTDAPDWLVEVVEDYDRVDGAVVDVDYPGTDFERPSGPEVQVFPTWSSDTLPRFVCAHEPGRPLGEGHCAHLAAGPRNPVRPEDLGRIECPPPYVRAPIGDGGGQLCVDRDRALGPHTGAMVELCRAYGGGAACDHADWSLRLTLATRGDGVCPRGATVDFHQTGYCVEGDEALGPFPAPLADECAAVGGGELCRAHRWPRDLLSAALARSTR